MDRATPGSLPRYGGFQITALVALRWLVGWHFLYEGAAKLSNPRWSSLAYLMESRGWLSDFFTGLAENAATLAAVDELNQWGLLAIGLALLLGCCVRTASVAALVLLALYYLAAPPFPGLDSAIPTEGSYLFVNKVLVEMGAVLVILGFPTAHQIGLDRIWHTKRRAEASAHFATEVAR